MRATAVGVRRAHACMGAIAENRYLVQCGWGDVPHLTPAMKAAAMKDYAPHLVDSRTMGTPSLGAGAIYPIPISDITVKPFEIPDLWPRAYGMDVGWNWTAAIWGAKDPNTKTVYLYAEHYRSHDNPASHAAAIKARGEWINGVIDPASNAKGQKDGAQLLLDYQELGLRLTKAENAVESGLLDVFRRLTGGSLKVFSSCQNWIAEYRLYRRDEEGKVVKEFDHLMDATRYLIVSGLDHMSVEPVRPTFNFGNGPADATVGY